jgi:hypothetical protein
MAFPLPLAIVLEYSGLSSRYFVVLECYDLSSLSFTVVLEYYDLSSPFYY